MRRARGVIGALTVIAAGGGWFGTLAVLGEGTTGPTALAIGQVALHSCPGDGGTITIGALEPGDRVWLVGTTGESWGVIRHPDGSGQPAWVPLAQLDTDVARGDLPELTCAGTVTVVATTTSIAATTTVAGQTTTTTTLPGTTTSTSSTTSTTAPTDLEPPLVTVSSDRAYLYAGAAPGTCAAETELLVSVIVADPTLPVSVRSIIATWDSPSGPQTANLSPVGSRFRLVITENGPVVGELPVTITATGADGVRNVGTGSLVVALRDPASFGCA